jgi:hypothetical protein
MSTQHEHPTKPFSGCIRVCYRHHFWAPSYEDALMETARRADNLHGPGATSVSVSVRAERDPSGRKLTKKGR